MTAPRTQERANDDSPKRLTRLVFPPLVLSVVVAAASSVVPLSYDEGNWLAVARRLAAGQVLYRDVTDNKSPALFALVRFLDRMPGSYTLARAVYLGVVTAALAWLATRFLQRLDLRRPTALILGVVIGLAAAMQAVLVVNFELPAMLLLIAGMTLFVEGQDVLGGIVAGLSALFDLRAIVLLPGVVLVAFAIGGRNRALRLAAGALVPAGAWAITVLSVGSLRYSLLELNVATRGGTTALHPGSQLAAFARSMLLPIVAVGVLTAPSSGTKSLRNASWFLLGAGLLMAIASVQPFDKYWTLTVPGLVALCASRVPRVRTGDRALAAVVLLVALVPSAVYAATTNRDESRLVHSYGKAATFVSTAIGRDGTFVRLDAQPFLGTFLATRDLTPAAVLDFLIAPTSRETANLAAVDRAISRAIAIVDDGALEQPAETILVPYRRLRGVFAARLDAFPCIKQGFGLTLHLRSDRCAAP